MAKNKRVKTFIEFNFPKRIEYFKNTQDNWHGNYNGNQVHILKMSLNLSIEYRFGAMMI